MSLREASAISRCDLIYRTIMKIAGIGIKRLGHVLRYIRIIYLRMAGVSIGKNCFISLGAKLDTCSGKIVIDVPLPMDVL